MNKLIALTSLSLTCLSLLSCNIDEGEDKFILKTGMAYVIATDSQGQGAITTYEPASMTATQNAYYAANKTNIGTNPISINFSAKIGYITVGNGLNIINPLDVTSTGSILGVESPAYSVFLGLDKAFVSNYNNNHISIINPSDRTASGKINLPENTFAQNPVEWDNKVYFNTYSDTECKIIEISSEKNEDGKVVDEISRETTIGVNSIGLNIDRLGRLWTLSVGDKINNPEGTVDPSIQIIDPVAMKKISQIKLINKENNKPLMTMLNGTGELYYILNGHVYKAKIKAEVLESEVFAVLENNLETTALAIDPVAQTIYVGYKINQNKSKVVRFDRKGKITDTFETAANISSVGFYTIY